MIPTSKKKCPGCGKWFPADVHHFFPFPYTKDRLTTMCIDCVTKHQEEQLSPAVVDEALELLEADYGKWLDRLSKPNYGSFMDYHWDNHMDRGKAVVLALASIRGLAHDKRKQIDSFVSFGQRARLRRVHQGREFRDKTWWEKRLGYTGRDLYDRLNSLMTDGMSMDALLSGDIHIDHIRPKASFIYQSVESAEFAKCWALNNLQPLWKTDNLTKGSLWNGKRVRRVRYNRKTAVKS